MLQEKIEESRKQLVHCIDAELVKMQYNLEHQQKQSEKASEHTVGTESVAACPEGACTGFAAGTTSGQHHVAVNEPEKINVQAEEQELEENCSHDLGEKREAMVTPLRSLIGKGDRKTCPRGSSHRQQKGKGRRMRRMMMT